MSMRVLVIEDNAANLELMTYLLRAFHHVAIEARDGETGIELALREEPDLVVCDIQLPELDGYGVLSALRSSPRMTTKPVIAVTAQAMTGERARILAAGFTGYISKPIDPLTFVSQLVEFAQRGRPTAPVDPPRG